MGNTIEVADDGRVITVPLSGSRILVNGLEVIVVTGSEILVARR
tara:strand:+ start:495 stop:626 length:132 start_codon:yes stop_codon:yes gene_type:complete